MLLVYWARPTITSSTSLYCWHSYHLPTKCIKLELLYGPIKPAGSTNSVQRAGILICPSCHFSPQYIVTPGLLMKSSQRAAQRGDRAAAFSEDIRQSRGDTTPGLRCTAGDIGLQL